MDNHSANSTSLANAACAAFAPAVVSHAALARLHSAPSAIFRGQHDFGRGRGSRRADAPCAVSAASVHTGARRRYEGGQASMNWIDETKWDNRGGLDSCDISNPY